MSQKSVKFHIESSDYFGTLATILSLVRQNIENGDNDKLNIKMLKNYEKELMYLQDKYSIVKK